MATVESSGERSWVEVARRRTPEGRVVVIVSVAPGEHVSVTVPHASPTDEQIERAVEAVLRTVDLQPPPTREP
jgi:hypothetical protein